ncbi:DUF389 domain-containing protein [Psychroflexus gondwanensis]|jgi:uncharacterized hydrophobic protein (TIGR00271 family)|uniref:Integral membrane protein n=1 Tax=Psychroflexus gondwanensis ACAM 44 TaxID=1189619 RepID=N1WUG3_9FLAO|nr:DUF389 domain-containing protein [Psychroflexus gondwanensis]EMY80769.1 integral membrane protein [Psychroflexus gondwanensis ACAM 44]TXE19452.1 DUF389 domain-containing protein [Psychroflexus gondwanensis]
MEDNNDKTSENTENDSNAESSEKVKSSLKESYGSIKHFLYELLDISHDTDREATMEAILKDIPFKGHTAWILIFSIIVASIGLNVSSTAVVIGAMLISPLMGPIVGLGFSVAINDVDTLRRSLINLGVMVGLSLLTAFLYFQLSPLTQLTPELEARTYPTILDVLVAIFGGLALIIAKAKRGTIITVISGVAIATALMPPLCTAGYGLAVWDLSIFGGAMYLFTINTIFIALTTFVVSKFLRFPLVKYANSLRRKRIAQIASSIAIIVMIPSIYLFYNLLKESYFTNDANTFVKEELGNYKQSFLQKNSTVISYNSGIFPTIEASFLGKEIPSEVITLWKDKLKNYPHLEDTELKVLQNENSENFDQLKYMVELKKRDSLELAMSKAEIEDLRYELRTMQKSNRIVKFDRLAQEIQLNYDNVVEVSYADVIKSNFENMDTIPTFSIKWNAKIDLEEKKMKLNKLKEWLSYKLSLENISVQSIN